MFLTSFYRKTEFQAVGEHMKYCIVYWSRYGNGKKIVDYVDKKLTDMNHDVNVFITDDVDPTSMPEADVYVFSAPAEAFRVQKNMRTMMKKLQGMDGKKYGIINTHGMKKRDWLGSMEKMLSKKNMEKVASVHFVMGKEVNDGAGLTDGWQSSLDDFISDLT